MKKLKWHLGDRESWMRFGAIAVFVALMAYLIYMVAFQFLPRLRGIGKAYNEARAGVFGVVLGAALAGTATASDGFFRPAPDRAKDYDPDQVYPRGRLFPFSGFSIQSNLLERARRDGFTMMGPYYGNIPRPEDVAAARAHGFKLICRVGVPPEALEKPDFEAIAETIRKQVREMSGHPEIAWWYLTPEELRYWRAAEIKYLEVAANAIREADPRRRPVWMYDPNHRNAKALAYTARHLDIVGKGFYATKSPYRDARAWIRWSIEQEVAAVAEANPRATPIVVPLMFTLAEGDDPKRIPAWVRHDIYLALIHGAKGVAIWSLARRPGFTHHEEYYQAYAAVAGELCGPLNLGRVFLFGEKRDGVRVRVAAGPARVSVKIGEETFEYPSLSSLDAAHGAERYLFVVNSANEPVSARVDGLPAAGVTVAGILGDGPAPALEGGGFSLELPPLGVRGFRFTRAGQPGSRR